MHNGRVRVPSTQQRLTLHQCRELARQVERSDNATAVRRLLRPRGLAILRFRLPVTLQLLRADRENRLVRAPDGSFVLLRAPVPWRPAQSDRTLTALRVLDTYWDHAVWFSSMIIVLLAAVVCALLPAAHTAALVLVLVVLVLVSVMMSAAILHSAWSMYTMLEPRRWTGNGAAVDQYTSVHWSVSLCHLIDTSSVDDLLREVLRRVSQLSGNHPGEQNTETDLVLIRQDAVSTPEALTALTESTLTSASKPDGAFHGVLLLHQPELRVIPDKRLLPATGVTLIFFGAAIAIANAARFVADIERGACAATSCVGRPADYGSALHWLLQRLLWSDPDGLSPATFRGWSLGWLTSFLTPVLVACLLVAVRQYTTHLDRTRDDFRNEVAAAVATTNTLVLVVADVERTAMIESIRAATGRTGPTPREARGRHTVFDLGVLSRTHVLLAQSEQGIEGSTAMTLTANELIRERRPDFVILVGICYGLDGEPSQRIGDVVVAGQVQNLNWRKHQTRNGIDTEWVRSGRVDPSPTLLDRFRAATVDWCGARVHRGLMLSENVLVDSAGYRAGLKQQFPDAQAGEMEGAGLYAASYLHGVDWIVVKAISDWGDGTKNLGPQPATAQQLAARHAADFVVHVLRGGGLDQPPRTADPVREHG